MSEEIVDKCQRLERQKGSVSTEWRGGAGMPNISRSEVGLFEGTEWDIAALINSEIGLTA